MQNIQEIFNHIKELQKEMKEINKMYKEALNNNADYKSLSEDMKTLREKVKSIENAVKADFTTEFDRLDVLKADLESERILLNDTALTKMMNGETVEIVDETNTKYEPIFSVSFKKAD